MNVATVTVHAKQNSPSMKTEHLVIFLLLDLFSFEFQLVEYSAVFYLIATSVLLWHYNLDFLERTNKIRFLFINSFLAICEKGSILVVMRIIEK